MGETLPGFGDAVKATVKNVHTVVLTAETEAERRMLVDLESSSAGQWLTHDPRTVTSLMQVADSPEPNPVTP